MDMKWLKAPFLNERWKWSGTIRYRKGKSKREFSLSVIICNLDIIDLTKKRFGFFWRWKTGRF
jgi:hypothetical protein